MVHSQETWFQGAVCPPNIHHWCLWLHSELRKGAHISDHVCILQIILSTCVNKLIPDHSIDRNSTNIFPSNHNRTIRKRELIFQETAVYLNNIQNQFVLHRKHTVFVSGNFIWSIPCIIFQFPQFQPKNAHNCHLIQYREYLQNIHAELQCTL